MVARFRHDRTGWRALGLAVPALLAFAGGAQASAAPVWTTPAAQLSTALDGGIWPVAAIDDQGDAVAVWEDQGALTGDKVAYRPAGGTWSADLFDPDAASLPVVRMSPNGFTVVLWTTQPNEQGTVVRAMTREPGGLWSAAESLSPVAAGEYAWAVDAATDPAGDTIALWRDGDGLASSYRPAGGAWQAPQRISGPFPGPVRVVLDDAGNATAIVLGQDAGQNTTVYATRRPAGGGWTDPVPITGSAPHGTPDVAVDGAGNVGAVWTTVTQTSPVVAAVEAAFVRPGNGGIEGPQTLIATGAPTQTGPTVAADAAGDFTFAWMRDGVPQAATRPANSAYTVPPAVDLAPAIPLSPGNALPVRVAMTPGGDTLAVWNENTAIRASWRAAGGGWEAPTTAAAASGFLNALSLDAGGDGVAVWFDPQTSTSLVWAAGVDSAPPRIDDLRVPAAGTAGEPISVSAATHDAVAGVRSVSWSFGDGSAVESGAQASHSFASPGTYTVTLTVTDAAGHSASASRDVVIAAPAEVSPPASPIVVAPTAQHAPGAVRKPSAIVRIPYRSGYRLPPGVSRRSACQGTISLTLRRGAHVLLRRTVRLNRHCRLTTTFTLTRASLHGAKRLTLVQRFNGNRALGARTDRIPIRVP